MTVSSTFSPSNIGFLVLVLTAMYRGFKVWNWSGEDTKSIKKEKDVAKIYPETSVMIHI